MQRMFAEASGPHACAACVGHGGSHAHVTCCVHVRVMCDWQPSAACVPSSTRTSDAESRLKEPVRAGERPEESERLPVTESMGVEGEGRGLAQQPSAPDAVDMKAQPPPAAPMPTQAAPVLSQVRETPAPLEP
jgi:hypothetical protein